MSQQNNPQSHLVFLGSKHLVPLIKKLYNTKFFSEINVEIKNKVLIVTVKENPIINEIKFEGEKASKFQDQLYELFILKENEAFVENSIKTDIKLIKDYGTFRWDSVRKILPRSKR